MTQITQEVSVLPSNPAELQEIFDVIKRADVSLIAIDQHKTQIKDDVDGICKKFKIKKKLLNKMIKTYYKQNLNQVTQETEEFTKAYEKVVNV